MRLISFSIMTILACLYFGCCSLISEGGLGLKNFPILNRAFLLKKFWDILTSSSMASTFFRRRFLNKFGQPCTYYKRSSIWPGFRPLFQDILDGSQWIIGSDTTLDFWHHNWLGSSVIERLNIPVSVANTLQLKLSNFINNGCWVCPINLQSLCAPFWEDIIKITLPFKDGFVDRLVWKSAKDGFGGIFRDHLGQVLCCFSGNLGIATALEAELQAVIHAIQMASQRGWRSLWIESDSTLVIHFLSSFQVDVPWRFTTEWFNCRTILTSMTVKVSHIYREGNRVADCLANFGADNAGVHWWDSYPPCAITAYSRDLADFPNYRFSF
uniref:uncharacterized protein LOC101295881 n=1 Tax=Fragaria vesca subsp. vesca TaxID=101020 RepID=UPI0005CB0243|nr:PREDICTED: uncharacterized protein LOC101295881 [Fragaria vesca subsp. vesca]